MRHLQRTLTALGASVSLACLLSLALVAACGDDGGQGTTERAPSPSTGEEATAPATEDAVNSGEEDPLPLPSPETEHPPDPDAPIVIVPGRSIGGVTIGMSRADVDALDILGPHPQYSAMTAPFSVYYDDTDRVHQVEVTLMHAGADVVVGATTIPQTATWEEAKGLLGDCEEDDLRIGGTIATCRGGGLQVIVGSGNGEEVWLRIPIAVTAN